MVGMAQPWNVRCALSVSFPHRFWLVTGDRRRRVSVTADDAVHLMASLWDPETGRAVPAGSVDVSITKDGEVVDERSLWPMLSQPMGVHYGDNVALPGDGTSTVEVSIGPVSARRTGGFAGRFDTGATATFDLDAGPDALDGVMYRELGGKAGQPGAVAPMSMEMMTVPQLPAPSDLPGRRLATSTVGDASLVVVTLDTPPVDDTSDGQYLAVSPRTPYNRYPLPLASVAATINRDGATISDDSLVATLDPRLGLHYGTVVDGIETGDTIEIGMGVPQLARHEGYETAFFPDEPVSVTVQ